MKENVNKQSKRQIIFKISRTLGVVFVAVGIFWLGLMIGSGNIRIHKLSSENKTLPANLDYKTIEQVYDELRQNYDGKLDVNTLLNGLKHGLANSTGDPYTSYFTPAEAKNFTDQLQGTFQGIGAELSKDKDGNLIVVAPIDGFPAQKAGLKSKDIIIAVNGDSTTNMSVDEAVSKIRGPKGTNVNLKIIRDKSQTLNLKITREEIKIPSVTTKTLNGNIGYIKISEYSDDTAELATAAANKFKNAGVKGIILDLRGNPGGELKAAVDVSSLWLGKNQTVLTTRRDGVIVDSYSAHGYAPLAATPTVVLINEGSASASEITAGALRDNKVATLIGIKSFGKGSVQDIENLIDGAMLKVTIARWYTPNGKNIDKQGIEPDKTVQRSDNDIKTGKDPQLDAALQSLR